MTIKELADFLAMDPPCLFDGNYRNRRGTVGYFVQMQCGEHWARISVSNVASFNGGMSRTELEAMSRDDLISDQPFPISLRTIAAAVADFSRMGVEWMPYHNAVFVPGVWLEEKSGTHWYMVSVSRVQSLEEVPSDRMDEPADEFLRRMGAFDKAVRPVARKRRSYG